MNFDNLLKGLRFGKRQETGVMAVIPLIADENATNSIAAFEDVKFQGTSTYGTMVFKNSSECPFIVPTGYSIITKQAAQDHGMTFATLLPPKSVQRVSNACCIEQTQPGHIDGSKVKEFNLLPLYIRKQHMKQYVIKTKEELKISDNLAFNRLWPIISDFQTKLVKHNFAHLVYFFNKFVDKLNRFNAEFEVVPNQRGAIILINNKVVGIEIAPTFDYWKTVWKSLIRDCYGAEVIRLTTLNLIEEFEAHQQQEVDLSNCTSIEEIRFALSNHREKQKNEVLVWLDYFLQSKILKASSNDKLIAENSLGNIQYHLFNVTEYDSYGEIYTQDDRIIYASILV